MLFIRDGPFDILSFREIHRLSDSGWEVDVVLLAFLAFNELNFGGVTHTWYLVIELDIWSTKICFHSAFI